MQEHLTSSTIPPGLKKRWEEFGKLSKECWERVKSLDLPVGEAFSKFFACMSSKGAHLMTRCSPYDCGRSKKISRSASSYCSSI